MNVHANLCKCTMYALIYCMICKSWLLHVHVENKQEKYFIILFWLFFYYEYNYYITKSVLRFHFSPSVFIR